MPCHNRLREYSQVFLWGIFYLLLVGAIQWQIPSPMDADTDYHAAVAYLIRDHGILRVFPWTPFSWLADNYADKELLFHLLFIPFLKFGWVTASRIVGMICGAGILMTTYLLLRYEKVANAWLWALIPLAVSHTFAYRFSIVRPHLLSISLAILVLWFAAKGKMKLLAAVSAIYPWAYVAWLMPLILVGIAETGRYLAGQSIRIRPLLMAIGGVAAGLALHPNTINLLRLAWIQIVDVLIKNAWGTKTGFDLGLEFLPETLEGWGRGLLVCVAMTTAALYFSWRDRRQSELSLIFTLATLGYAVMTAKSCRFLEYFVPFSAISLALASKNIRWRFLPQTLIIISLIYMLGLNHRFLRSFADSPNCLPATVISFMQGKIPPGSQVFTPDWDYTGELMLALPERKFIVGLDPTFFYLKDPDLYRLWYRISHDAPPDTVDQIRNKFASRYVIYPYPIKILPQDWTPFLDRLYSDQRVKTYFIEDLWILFDLGSLN